MCQNVPARLWAIFYDKSSRDVSQLECLTFINNDDDAVLA